MFKMAVKFPRIFVPIKSGDCMKKINYFGSMFVIGLLCINTRAVSQNASEKQMKAPAYQSVINNQNIFDFPPLPYSYDALEPYIDKLTVEIHYSKHHKAYYDNFTKAIAGTEMESMDIIDIFKNISKYPVAIRNNGGGYFNHTFYWESMKPQGGETPTGELSASIIKTFGSFEEFKKQFEESGKMRFGSGWAWLCLDDKGKLFICSTPNQDNPLMDIAEKKGIPLLTVDVWEHAYYLKYQNKRADNLTAFWNVIDWNNVSKRYENAYKSLNLK